MTDDANRDKVIRMFETAQQFEKYWNANKVQLPQP